MIVISWASPLYRSWGPVTFSRTASTTAWVGLEAEPEAALEPKTERETVPGDPSSRVNDRGHDRDLAGNTGTEVWLPLQVSPSRLCPISRLRKEWADEGDWPEGLRGYPA